MSANINEPYAADEAAGSTVDIRPEGMTEKQDTIIQHVAEHVVSSCNSAAYYQKLRQKTQYNVNFNFLEPSHPYYEYYVFLVESYQHWKNTAALAAEQDLPTMTTIDPTAITNVPHPALLSSYGNGGGAYYQSDDAAQGLATANTAAVEVAVVPGSTTWQQDHQHMASHAYDSGFHQSSASGPAGGGVLQSGSAVVDNSNVNAGMMNRSMVEGGGDDDDDDDDEYELVEVNGVKQLVPRNKR